MGEKRDARTHIPPLKGARGMSLSETSIFGLDFILKFVFSLHTKTF